MTTLAALATANVTIPAGYSLLIGPGSETQISRYPGQPHFYGPSGGKYGPVRVSTQVSLTSIRGAVNYYLQAASSNVVITAEIPDGNDGLPVGTVYMVTP